MDTSKALFPVLNYHPNNLDEFWMFHIRNSSGQSVYAPCISETLFRDYDGPGVHQVFSGYLVFRESVAAKLWLALAAKKRLIRPDDTLTLNCVYWAEIPEVINAIRCRYMRQSMFAKPITGVTVESISPLYYEHGVAVHCAYINV